MSEFADSGHPEARSGLRLAQFQELELEEYLRERLSDSSSVGPPIDQRNREQPHDIFVRVSRETQDPEFSPRLWRVIGRLLTEEPVSPASASRCYFALCLVEELRIPHLAEQIVRFVERPNYQGYPSAERDIHRCALTTAITLNLERDPRVESVLREDLRREPNYCLTAASGLAHLGPEQALDALCGVLATFSRSASDDLRGIVRLLLVVEARWRAYRFLPLLQERASNMEAPVSELFLRVCARSKQLSKLREELAAPAQKVAASARAEVGLPQPLDVIEIQRAVAVLENLQEPAERRKEAEKLASGVWQTIPHEFREEWAERRLVDVERLDGAIRVPLLPENVLMLTSDPKFWEMSPDCVTTEKRKFLIDIVDLKVYKKLAERERLLERERVEAKSRPLGSRSSSSTPPRHGAAQQIYECAVCDG